LARRLRNSLLEAMVQSASDGIVVVDAALKSHPVIFANAAFEAMTGYTLADLKTAGLGVLQGEDTRQKGVGEMSKALEEGRSCEVLLKNYRKDGTLFWNRLRLVPVEHGGKIAWWVGIATDITELKGLKDKLRTRGRALKEVRGLAPDDRLTGLRSRSFFDELLLREWRVCLRDRRSLTLFLFDMDFFGAYNDTFGKKAGDSCLRLAARAIRGSFRRGGDVVARHDGQRFACFASGMEQEPAIEFAGRICERVRQLCIHHPRSPGGRFVTMSAGVVTGMPEPEGTAGELLAACEEALGRAKSAGRGQASG
jgi:diguanylate cyclase (GGDEF)-like protein/PAS domain S-box-containing protein